MIGNATESIVDTNAFERDTVLFPVFHKDKCLSCGRCFLSCRDGGHQAIAFDDVNPFPKLDGSKCVGCHLCILVYPNDAISYAKKQIEKK